jgi:hypothetical protein
MARGVAFTFFPDFATWIGAQISFTCLDPLRIVTLCPRTRPFVFVIRVRVSFAPSGQHQCSAAGIRANAFRCVGHL